MKIAICGSMSAAKEMIECKKELKKLGHSITVPAGTEKFLKGEVRNEDKWEKMEIEAFKTYFNIIKKNDAILVVNIDKNNIRGYIGANSLIEMAFAYVLDKKIFLLNEIPKLNYVDEIIATKPIVLNGDLKKIN